MTDAAPLGPSRASSCRLGAAVLYVEDHEADVALMEDYLGGLDAVSLSVAASIEHAIESARRAAPSIVLLDVGLVGEPGGIERLARFRALPEMRDVLVIGLSGTAHPRARALARHLGFHRFVAKPIDLTVLGDALSSVVPSVTE